MLYQTEVINRTGQPRWLPLVQNIASNTLILKPDRALRATVLSFPAHAPKNICLKSQRRNHRFFAVSPNPVSPIPTNSSFPKEFPVHATALQQLPSMEQRFPGKVSGLLTPVASNRPVLKSVTFFPVAVSGFHNKPESLLFLPSVGDRPTNLSSTRQNLTSASPAPAVNDGFVDGEHAVLTRFTFFIDRDLDFLKHLPKHMLQNFRCPSLRCFRFLPGSKTKDIDLRHHFCPKPGFPAIAR